MKATAAGRQSANERIMVAADADVAAVRRAVALMVHELFPDDEQRPGRAELVASELATNLVRHGNGGWMLIRVLTPSSIEMLAVDGGPGIDGLDHILAGAGPENGPAPSKGGLGCGLRAVKRASARFDVFTRPGGGTVVLAVVDLTAARPAHPERTPRCCAGVSMGIVEPCGDGWAFAAESGAGGDLLSVAVVDGLGHGAKASTATEAALAEFAADPHDLEGFVLRANARMRDTRGAAVTLCRIDSAAHELTYLAIGNVNGRIVTPTENRGLVTYSGTLGLHVQPPKTRIATVPFPAGASLVLWTDGLSSRVEPDPDLLDHDPAVVAATLHRDHARDRDDATVVVVTPGASR